MTNLHLIFNLLSPVVRSRLSRWVRSRELGFPPQGVCFSSVGQLFGEAISRAFCAPPAREVKGNLHAAGNSKTTSYLINTYKRVKHRSIKGRGFGEFTN